MKARRPLTRGESEFLTFIIWVICALVLLAFLSLDDGC